MSKKETAKFVIEIIFPETEGVLKPTYQRCIRGKWARRMVPDTCSWAPWTRPDSRVDVVPCCLDTVTVRGLEMRAEGLGGPCAPRDGSLHLLSRGGKFEQEEVLTQMKAMTADSLRADGKRMETAPLSVKGGC